MINTGVNKAIKSKKGGFLEVIKRSRKIILKYSIQLSGGREERSKQKKNNKVVIVQW